MPDFNTQYGDHPVQNLVETIPNSKLSRKKSHPNTQYGDEPVLQNLVQTIPGSKPSRKMSHFNTQYGDDPVQNVAQDSKPPDGLRRAWEEEMHTAARKVDSVPPQHRITTAIVHQERSPWLSTGDIGDIVNMKNVLQRAKSMNVNTGKPTKTRTIHLADDTNVKYNWADSVKETPLETELDAVTGDGLVPTSSEATETAAEGEQQKAVDTYASAENNDSPPSDGDYQLPMSVASDQWSSYDPGLGKNDHRRDEETARQAADVSNQCYDTDAPDYVNTSALAADAAGDGQ